MLLIPRLGARGQTCTALDVALSGPATRDWHRGMAIGLHRLCVVAQSLRDLHGVCYTACILFDNDVDIEGALTTPVRKRPG